jgi:hypothetical protein
MGLSVRATLVLPPPPGGEGWGEGLCGRTTLGWNRHALSPCPPAFAGAGSPPPGGGEL